MHLRAAQTARGFPVSRGSELYADQSPRRVPYDETRRLVTLGVATEPYPAGGRSHDYVLCEGEVWEAQADFVNRLDDLYAQHFPSDHV